MRRVPVSILIAILLFSVSVLAVPQRPAYAALFSANNAAALIAAINAANATAAPDVIVLTGDIALTAVHNVTDGANGLPAITTPITLEGGGYAITGAGGFRIFYVAAGGTLTLNTVTLSGGQANAGGLGDLGGGVLNLGTLNVTGSVFNNNVAVESGGGISSAGALTLTNSRFTNNRADGVGGGGGVAMGAGAAGTVLGVTFQGNAAPNGAGGGFLGAVPGAIVIRDSTFTGNTALNGGGMASVAGGVQPQIVSSTFNGNTATNNGGGLNTDAVLTNSTVSGNTATNNGGGAFGVNPVFNSTIFGNTAAAGGGIDTGGVVQDSIIVNNTGGDCLNVAGGGNNRDLDGSCVGSLVLDGIIGLLADNGGATLTHYPGPSAAAGSAIDTAPLCTVTVDQRGVPRDWDGNGDGTPACDIGAVELSAALPFLDFDFDITDLVEDPPGTATVNIRLTFPAPGPIQVFFKITGTATTGLDYTVSGLDAVYSLIIPAGATTAAFSLTSINDGIEEPVENIALEMAFIGPARRVTTGQGNTRTLAVIRERPAPAPPEPTQPASAALSILKSGFIRGGQVEWVITVSNPGPGAAANLVISDTLPAGYRIDRVDTTAGSATTAGQTVTVTIPTLPAGGSVQVTVLTTVTGGQTVGSVTGSRNVACLRAAGMSADRCAEALPVRALPLTGESPLWRGVTLLMALSGMVALGSVLLLVRRSRAHTRKA